MATYADYQTTCSFSEEKPCPGAPQKRFPRLRRSFAVSRRHCNLFPKNDSVEAAMALLQLSGTGTSPSRARTAIMRARSTQAGRGADPDGSALTASEGESDAELEEEEEAVLGERVTQVIRPVPLRPVPLRADCGWWSASPPSVFAAGGRPHVQYHHAWRPTSPLAFPSLASPLRK